MRNDEFGNRDCPICECPVRDLIYNTPIGQHVNCCNFCGMVFSDNTPLQDYSSDSIYACSETYDSQPHHYRHIVRNILSHGVLNSASVLDVGCATGGLMEAFVRFGFKDVYGVSLSEGEVHRCREKGLQAEVVDIASEKRSYDLITLSHVLEHVPNVLGLLKALRNNVNPQGYIYIEVPDALRYSNSFSSVCQGFNTEHINHFDLSHLIFACMRADLSVGYQGSYYAEAEGGKFYPVIWVMVKPSESLKNSIESYAKHLKSKIQNIQANIHKSLHSYKKIAIWGTGQTAKILFLSRCFEDHEIDSVTDTNPVYHKKVFAGREIVSPQNFHPSKEVPIVVCSQLSQDAIVESIRSLGLNNTIITLDDGNIV